MQRLLLMAVLMFPAWCFSQQSTFQKLLHLNSSSTQADEIVSTNDGGYAIAGVTNVAGNTECFLSRYNSLGDNEWTKIYYDLQSHQIYQGIDDTEIFCNQYVRFLLYYDDGFVVGGGIDSAVFITYSSGATVGYSFTRMFAIRTDNEGNLLWSKKFIANDNSFGEEAMIASDGSIILAGSVTQPGLVLRDIGLWKLDGDGTIQWAKSYGGNFDEGVAEVIEAAPSEWIICGTSESFSNNQNIYLLNTDSAGELNWSSVYGSSGFDYGKGMVKTTDGYYIFGNAGTGNPSYIALLKTDASGALQWANTYGDFLLDSPEGLFTTPNGNLVMLCNHYTGAYDILACEIDSTGNFLDARIYGESGSGDDFVSSMITEENAYTLVGATNGFGGSQFFSKAYLIRTHDGLLSDCFSEPVNYSPIPVSLTVTTAATSVTMLEADGYQMMVSVLDSSFMTDTLCLSISTNVEPGGSESFYIFPNPITDEMVIESIIPLKEISLFEISGSMIFSKKATNMFQNQLQLDGIPEGIYLLRILTAESIICKHIVVTR